MQMTFRWYGEGNDSITPQQIKQIPGVTGLVWALHYKQAGEVWTIEEIEEARKQIEGAGFNMDVVESVNVHDDIKIGLPTRDRYIENYKETLRNLAPTTLCRFLTGPERICFIQWRTAPRRCFMRSRRSRMIIKRWPNIFWRISMA